VGSDIVCLPENVVGMCAPEAQMPQTVPGPATDRFSQLASRHRMYVIAPLIERSGGRLYGTAVLIDRAGAIAGKYRKVHPTTVAAEQKGHSAGDSLPVFRTDFGTIGIMICYDNFFPETARVLALKGAEVLFFPTAGDGRGPLAFEVILRARAIDNCIPVVASVYQNQGRSCIVDARGYLLADSCEIPGVVTAEVDLDCKITRHEVSGGVGDLKEILFKARRPQMYREIVEGI
jgi:predicted amidohydrolase